MTKLLTREEAAALLGFAPNTLAKWAMTGRNLSVIRIGRTVRYSRQEIEEFIMGCTAPSSSRNASNSNDIEQEGADND